MTVRNNTFKMGTNLLGKVHNIPVTFDMKPIIESNTGLLDLNNEEEEL